MVARVTQWVYLRFHQHRGIGPVAWWLLYRWQLPRKWVPTPTYLRVR